MKNTQPVVFCLYRGPGFGADQNQKWQEQQRQCRAFGQEQVWTIAKDSRGAAVSSGGGSVSVTTTLCWS